jgi:cellulose synthase/poly-beta-1,6-N-acetylglucosamine synthase-like glycosyltransferase
MLLVQYLFWISTFLVAYVYVGYPVMAWGLARIIGRPTLASPVQLNVTVLIAAYNEASHIEETVRNKLAQQYPEELLEIIVVSDGSTDGTDEIVRDMGSRVRLIRQEPRAGKTAALNLAIQQARGDIVVFSDANSMYSPDAIGRLVSNFADPTVGYVTGKMVYVNTDGSLIGDGCSGYMKYENWLRRQETRLASVIGVDGGIDAVRKSLYRPMRPDQLPDFVLPLSVAEQGYRVVYEADALLQEASLSRQDEEYRMRVRVSLRALWALWDMRRLMNPFRHGLLSFQLVSHKVLRYMSFVPLMVLFASSVVLAPKGGIYLVALVLQLAALTLAVIGWTRRSRHSPTVVAFPYYFSLLNIAVAHAALRFVRGDRQVTWTPRAG